MSTSLFLGIGGAGMKGLAYLLEQQGEHIIGYDNNPEFSTCTLDEANQLLPSIQQLIYTDAAPEDHPLRISAREHGIPELAYHQALGEFSKQYKTIAITGTHGKSSTTAFMAHIMMQYKPEPTVLIGAHMKSLAGEHAQLGDNEYFVVEADEYRKHFLTLHPKYILITSIDYDHPDAFSSLEDVESAYSQFINHLQPNGKVIVGEEEYKNHPNIAWSTDTMIVPTSDVEHITAQLNGPHMRRNAALAVAAAQLLGIQKQDAIHALSTFPGLVRRFEHIGTIGALEVRSDYGHHPAEITATIEGARASHPKAHIIAIFEAHMPLRLHTFFDAFAAALACADEAIITPPFVPEGRDASASLKDAEKLAESISKQGISAEVAFDDIKLAEIIEKHSKTKELSVLAIIFSAGTLDLRMRKIVNNR